MTGDRSLIAVVVATALLIGGSVWYGTRQARYDECRQRCAARGFKTWTYQAPIGHGGGCSCGGSTDGSEK